MNQILYVYLFNPKVEEKRCSLTLVALPYTGEAWGHHLFHPRLYPRSRRDQLHLRRRRTWSFRYLNSSNGNRAGTSGHKSCQTVKDFAI